MGLDLLVHQGPMAGLCERWGLSRLVSMPCRRDTQPQHNKAHEH
jgi:hypothetical protein